MWTALPRRTYIEIGSIANGIRTAATLWDIVFPDRLEAANKVERFISHSEFIKTCRIFPRHLIADILPDILQVEGNMARYKMTIVLGELAEPLEQAAEERGVSLSEEIRIRLAESLNIREPELPMGFAAMTPKERSRMSRLGSKSRKKS